MLASTHSGEHLRPRVRLIPPLVAALGAALLVVQWAGGRPLWLDEEMIAINLRDRSVGALAGALSLGQTAPYGWLALQHAIVLAAGIGERALRVVPLSFGVATLAVAVWIGRRWLGVVGATTLVVLAATGRWLTFYVLELKQYSADVFFALLLPALAVRAIEDPARALTFWIVAAVAQWFANGALFVTPACVLVLAWAAFRRDGGRGLFRAVTPGAIWLALFALHYLVVLRHALGSAYLQSTWAFAFPPAGSGLAAAARWLIAQLAPLAEKPGGTMLGVLLWIAALAGVLLASDRKRPLAWAFGFVPLTAFALALVRLVPLYERLSIWIVPALYVGVALLADVTTARRRSTAVLAGAAVLVLVADITARGLLDLRQRPSDSNRSLDDRSAIRWLQERAEAGDAWLTTHYALPALWWYGGATTTDRLFTVAYQPDKAECPAGNVARALDAYPRVVVYLGFRFDDTPPGFDDLLVDRLGELGAVVAYRRFAVRGIGLIVDRRQRAYRPATLSQLDAQPADTAVRPDGCITIAPARW
jgi:hypothetical protein